MTVIDRELVRKHFKSNKTQVQNTQQNSLLYEQIKALLEQHNAKIVAHYYTDPSIQKLAEITGGIVADSLEMARFGMNDSADTLIVAGVKFMGETAKILNPEKNILMPNLEATCSLDIGCPVDDFSKFCDQNPDRTVVVYANTSAAVKARADWVVTSSCAIDIIEHLMDAEKKIIWGPDKHLGQYILQKTDADMLLWNSSCIVHEEFKAKGILDLKKIYPDAVILVHPESPQTVIEIADVVGSTSQLIKASQKLSNKDFIVATDKGIFYKMKQLSKDKNFISAPTAGNGATCKSCANCPWMAMNNLDSIIKCFNNQINHEILVDEVLRVKALNPLQRMLNFTKQDMGQIYQSTI